MGTKNSADNILSSSCAQICNGNCGSVACMDCVLGEHAASADDFWNWVNNFNPNRPMPLTLSVTDILPMLNSTDCSTGVAIAIYNPSVNTNLGNLTIYIGPPSDAPIINAGFISVSLSIILFYATTGTFNNAAAFNFYLGGDAHDANPFPLFNITDSFGQVIYFADMSGLIPLP